MSPGDKKRALEALKKQFYTQRGSLVAGEVGIVGHDYYKTKQGQAEAQAQLDKITQRLKDAGADIPDEVEDYDIKPLSPEEIAKIKQQQTPPEMSDTATDSIASQFNKLSPGVKAGLGAAGILGGTALVKKLTDKKKKKEEER
jgi:hypothetical protein